MRNYLLGRARRLLLLLLLYPALAGAPALAEQGREGNSPEPSEMLLEVKTEKAQVHLREPVQLIVTLLTGPAAVRNIEYPRLKSPAFTLGEFAPPKERSVVRDGREFTAYEFTATLTPKRSGTIQLGPAELSCEMLAPAGGPAAFFGGTEARSVTVHSAVLPLTVLPLPVAGRPAGFGGAVGRFTVTRSARPAAVQAGDPITVRTVIRGAGNIEALSCNSIAAAGLRSYPPRAAYGGDSLVCEQVVIPQSPAVTAIPAVEVPFFDPGEGQYHTAGSAAIPLQVSAVPVPAPLATPRTIERVIPAAAAPPKGGTWPVAIVAVLPPAAVVAGIVLVRRRRRRTPLLVSTATDPASDIGSWLEAVEAALASGDVDNFYTASFRALQSSVGRKLSLPPAGITGPLHQDALPAEMLHSARSILSQCDKVRYGSHQPCHAEMSNDLLMLRELVNNSHH
jgi:hypothetical protein